MGLVNVLSNLADPSGLTVGISYEDKFGPLGVIGVVAGRRVSGRLDVSTWVMSCRAFSRRIEVHTLRHLFDGVGVDVISLDYKETDAQGRAAETSGSSRATAF